MYTKLQILSKKLYIQLLYYFYYWNMKLYKIKIITIQKVENYETRRKLWNVLRNKNYKCYIIIVINISDKLITIK